MPMKRICVILLCFLYGCSAAKPIVTDSAVLRSHPKPIKIYGIGDWTPGYVVITLIDTKNQYFTIITQKNDRLHIGSIYSN